jgi:hypothetical protein
LSRGDSSSGRCAVSWSVVPSVGVENARLDAVAADAPDDAWAAGGPSNFTGSGQRMALIEHWDGRRWRITPGQPFAAVLEGVAATARNDAWVVGERTDPSGRLAEHGLGAVAEHWDGTRWRHVLLPRLQRLSAVAATSATNAWAVGADTRGAAVALHWNGLRWRTQLRLPNAELRDVAALSTTDVWAVGGRPAPSDARFLELHWNGKRWSTYSQPSPSGGHDSDPRLIGVAAAARNDVWVAGDAGNSGGPAWPDTAVFHWNGRNWRKALTPQLLWVEDLAARTADDLWVAALRGNGDAYGGGLLERRIRTRWQRSPLDGGEEIDALTTDQTQGLWAVGFIGSHFTGSTGFPSQTRPIIKRARCS